jgi:hypothetical protein
MVGRAEPVCQAPFLSPLESNLGCFESIPLIRMSSEHDLEQVLAETPAATFEVNGEAHDEATRPIQVQVNKGQQDINR